MTNEQKLRAIKIYCEGVRSDFEYAHVWMDNIIAMIDGPEPKQHLEETDEESLHIRD